MIQVALSSWAHPHVVRLVMEEDGYDGIAFELYLGMFLWSTNCESIYLYVDFGFPPYSHAVSLMLQDQA